MKVTQLRKKAETFVIKGHEDYRRRVNNPVDSAVLISRRTGETDSCSPDSAGKHDPRLQDRIGWTQTVHSVAP